MSVQPIDARYATVVVARPLGPLTYSVPAWIHPVVVGQQVLVPLGRRQETGYVVEVSGTCAFDPKKVRPIAKVVEGQPAFDAEQLAFFRWIADYYLVPLGRVVHTALPSAIKARIVRALEPTEAGLEALTAGDLPDEEGLIVRELVARPGLTRRGLLRRLGQEIEEVAGGRAIDRALNKAWIQGTDREIGQMKGKVKTVALAGSLDAARSKVPRAGERMRAALRAIDRADGPIDLAELVAEQGDAVRDAVRRLAKSGAVVIGERDKVDVMDQVQALGPSAPPVLNADQQAALAALTAPDASGAFLLFGVTGSGKTEVFLGAAQAALDRQRQVLVLVPEIGLTPQLVGRFRARFGDRIAVLHSGLTGGDRLAEWRRIRSGAASVVVGARSALFAPFQALGLIVVDEEHDDSYKQDDGVPYNARDLAVVLGKRKSCPVVLASATPSLESWTNACTDRYTMLRLPHRATAQAVPAVELVDMTQVEHPEGGPRRLFAPEVVDALRSTFAQGGSAIVLYNRRGYATIVQCNSCGGTWECPNCGISMTLHRRAQVLACHYCGLKRPYDGTCPACRGSDLDELGKGTERVLERLTGLFPDVSIGRMDADTTSVRGAHHRILQAFRRGETQLLVGTQIVAKGHDFPNVHLAVVVSADQGFRMPDFRASERTFALLVQLAGRAGRGEVAGRVMVQTWKPDHYALQDLDDVEGFLRRESRLRKVMRYPPVSRLVLIRLDGVDRRVVFEEARELAGTLRFSSGRYPGVEVLGPAPAALPRLVGRWRVQVVLRGTEIRSFRAFLDAHRERLTRPPRRGVRRSVDVDPRHLM